MKILNLINFGLLGSVLFFTSCVGTVKTKNASQGNIVSNGSKTVGVSFAGLIQANPISHDKIELTFYPAKGDQANLTYEIYINGSPTPIKISGLSLPINSKGSMYTTITNLSINTTYNFNMKVTETGSASSSQLDPTKSLSATTFSNETADFLGISSVTLSAGDAGKNSVIVKWLPAKSTGSSISPRANDPVAYEVRYISQSGGLGNLNNSTYAGSERTILQNPSVLGTSPSLSTDSQMTITGLSAGGLYYFQVRAIHKNYVLFSSDKSYKREQNTKYLSIRTIDSSGVIDFPVSQVSVTNPTSVEGRTQLDVSWSAATGSFDHYRVCFIKVADPDNFYFDLAPGGTPANKIVPEDDKLINATNYSVIDNCIGISADLNYYRLLGLEEYAYYQVKVYACKTAACDFNNRIASDVKSKRIKSNVAPFAGIIDIKNPDKEFNADLVTSALSTITAKFDPPLLSSGFINKFTLYCYSNFNDTSPVEIPTDGTPSNYPTKSICDKIRVPTAFPVTSDEFGAFAETRIDLPQLGRDGVTGIDGVKKYCFSLVPSIQSAYLVQEDKANAAIKCFTPQVKTPNILEFPGRDFLCSTVGKSISVNWPLPTGGLYSKFALFYQEKVSGSEFFNYQNAITEYTANTPVAYKWVDNIDKAMITQSITNLFPGRKYNIGVIPYLNDGAIKRWGQPNFNTGECAIPLPKAHFNEWTDIMALGPKEDGLTPQSATLKRKYLLETLNDDSVPVEIEGTVANFTIPEPTNSLSAAREGGDLFDGIYGRYDSVETNPPHQYSNSGMIKISWLDVHFYSGADLEYMDDRVQSLEPATIRPSRKFGYKVYRSDDNKLTWVNLTQYSDKNVNQSPANSGLIHSANYSWRKRNNDATIITNKISSFTDYSVKFSGYSGDTDRARVYYYKIVPVFDGKELLYDSTDTNPNHHIIKVTLPPRNMALVHRMIANRTICMEMEKNILKGPNQYYSCDYDGIASSGLTPPYAKGNTVYDVGGDIFIDRFELGIPFTRGDRSETNSNSEYTNLKADFNGKAQNGNNFVGCYNDPIVGIYEPGNGVNKASVYLSNEIAPGDCIGRDYPVTLSKGSTTCSSPTGVETRDYWYPGAPGGDQSSNCTFLQLVGEVFSDLSNPASNPNTFSDYMPTRGEFGAVYYMRSTDGSFSLNELYTLKNFPAANGQKIVDTVRNLPSNAFINIPYLNSLGKLIPRWLSINTLFGRLSLVTSTNVPVASSTLDIYDKTANELLANNKLYDGSNLIAPTALVTSTRFDKSTTKLARIFTSNASKLPPAQGLSQKQFHKICSTYKIQVGYESTTLGFKNIGLEKSKRLMRKKESTVAAAWPPTYNSAKVTQLENGTGALSCNGTSKVTPAGTSTLQKQSKISVLSPSANRTNPFLITGSSSLDQDGIYSSEACTSRFGLQDLAGNVRENNSDALFCDFSIPKVKVGPTSLPNSSALLDIDSFIYNVDPATSNIWVESAPESGACSVVERGGNRSGDFESGGAFNSIYLPDGVTINTSIFASNPAKVGAKTFDQDSVLASRNGDASFLDFGSNNLAPALGKANAFNDSLSTYFSVPLGIPLTCQQGCNGVANGGDNRRIISDKRTSGNSYVPGDLGTGVLANSIMLDFPTNNATFDNIGVDEVSSLGTYNSNDPDGAGANYVSGVTLNADPLLNELTISSVGPGANPSPGALYRFFWKVNRSSHMKFTTGGSADTNPSRYSFNVEGPSDTDDSSISDKGGRCAILIEDEE